MASSESKTTPTNLDELYSEIDEERMRSLEQELKFINHLERAHSKGKILTEEEQALLRTKPLLCYLLQVLSDLFGLPRCPLLLKSSTNPTKLLDNHDLCLGSSQVGSLKKRRYLCISYGFMICCLDLKQKRCKSKENCSLIQPLPNIATIKLLEECIPVSMGLFKLHSKSYVIGGQEFPRLLNPPRIWDTSLFGFLYQRWGVEGSSLETRHLSLVGRDLSLNECNLIGPLNKPKVWPIVEKLGDKIHVIESLPQTFSKHKPKTIPTHEVLNLNHLEHGWAELPPLCEPNSEVGAYITDYIVFGDRLHVKLYDDQGLGFFDSEEGKWEWHADHSYFDCEGLLSIKHVTQIFLHGFGICSSRFPYGDTTRDALYVIIALGENEYAEMIGVAYLVSSRGQVLCFQRLPHFFDKFDYSFQGSKQGTIIKVDEDGETMCAIFEGMTDDTRDKFTYITTFTAEVFACPNLLVPQLMSRATDEDDLDQFLPPIEKNFVRVDVEDIFVFQRQVDPKTFYDSDWQPGYKACFL